MKSILITIGLILVVLLLGYGVSNSFYKKALKKNEIKYTNLVYEVTLVDAKRDLILSHMLVEKDYTEMKAWFLKVHKDIENDIEIMKLDSLTSENLNRIKFLMSLSQNTLPNLKNVQFDRQN